MATVRGNQPALIGESTRLGYRALVELSDRYAAWVLRQELEAGAMVCLLMPNCPDYVAIWFGITHTRCGVALINTNLVGEALAHSIRASGARQIIVAASLLPPVLAVLPQLQPGTRIWVHGEGGSGDFSRIDLDIVSHACVPGEQPASHHPQAGDRALLIYTSGTTGLPKAATVTHARILEWSSWFAGMMDARPEDRLYDCLPMYHSTGGVVAIGAMLRSGGSVVIRTRFSASRFWKDVADSGCTIFQYIGELCRYLARGPRQPAERQHRLRLACGNGMRGDVWEEFQERFGIPRILEFYAATEGNVSLYNCEGKPGAIGRIPPFLRNHFPVELIRIDLDTGEPLRDEAGFCIRCDADEAGEAVGQVLSDSLSAARRFDGYTDREASARKTVSDVFAAGDLWFRTGDLMRRDRAGYYYFLDRLGDTFRWKGENVSTAEVASVLAACPGILDAVVYGVAIAGAEGRAGMAALATGDGFDFAQFRDHMRAHLPEYAHPVFLRLCDALAVTGTFKLTKAPYVAAGLATASTHGTLWFNDRKGEQFVACDAEILRRIEEGALAL